MESPVNVALICLDELDEQNLHRVRYAKANAPSSLLVDSLRKILF